MDEAAIAEDLGEDYQSRIIELVTGSGRRVQSRINELTQSLSLDQFPVFLLALVNSLSQQIASTGGMAPKGKERKRVDQLCCSFVQKVLGSPRGMSRIWAISNCYGPFASLLTVASLNKPEIGQQVIDRLIEYASQMPEGLAAILLHYGFSGRGFGRADWVDLALQSDRGQELLVNTMLWARTEGLELDPANVGLAGPDRARFLTKAKTLQQEKLLKDGSIMSIKVVLNSIRQDELQDLFQTYQQEWEGYSQAFDEVEEFSKRIPDQCFESRWSTITKMVRVAISEGDGDLIEIRWPPLPTLGPKDLWIIREPEQFLPPNMLIRFSHQRWGKRYLAVCGLVNGRLVEIGQTEHRAGPIIRALNWLVLDAYECLTTTLPKQHSTTFAQGQSSTCRGSKFTLRKRPVSAYTRSFPAPREGQELSQEALERRKERHDSVTREAFLALGRSLRPDEVFVCDHVTIISSAGTAKAALTIDLPQDPSLF